MTIYAVHVPEEARRGSREGLDRTIAVKDGFHWLALFFPLIWLLFNRCWLASLFFVVVALAIALGGPAVGLGEGTVALLEILLALGIAFHAGDIKSRALERRGLPLADVVTADSRDEAERRFFARWIGRGAIEPVPQPAGSSAPAAWVAATGGAGQPVIGLFPQAGGRA
jgi:hypothetical protein